LIEQISRISWLPPLLGCAAPPAGEVLVVMDADLSHRRKGSGLAPLFTGAADMVIGIDMFPADRPGLARWRLLLSRTGAVLAYPLTGVHDSISGFFAIGRSRLLEYASPPPAGFKIVFETIVRSSRRLRVVEIPIAFRNRIRGKSKMSFVVALRFFVRWLFAVLRHVVHGLYRPAEIARSTMSNASTD
jgi:dolichol-phosphate mannosyltransferase